MAVVDLEQGSGAAGQWQPSPAGRAARVAALCGLGLFILLVPVLTPTVFLNVVSTAAVFGIIALSINILVGYTGQVSLGHQAFVGVGAFTSGYILTEAELPFLAGVVMAAITGGVAALVLGGVALRIRGLYLALVTLAYGLFAQEVVFNIRELTGGGAGMPADRPSLVTGDVAYAYLCMIALAIALVFDWRLTASKAGRAIQAIRDDERVAASWGINVTAYKLLAFVISGALAGIAGALFASIEQVVSPLDFGVTLALVFLLMVVVGGIGSRAGVVQAGILVAILPSLLDWTNETFGFFPFTILNASLFTLVLALLVLLTLAFFPGGFAQLERPIARWLMFGPWREQPIVLTSMTAAPRASESRDAEGSSAEAGESGDGAARGGGGGGS